MVGSNGMKMRAIAKAVMKSAEMNAILATMTPDEVHDALWMIDVFERWSLAQEETAVRPFTFFTV